MAAVHVKQHEHASKKKIKAKKQIMDGTNCEHGQQLLQQELGPGQVLKLVGK